MRGREVVNVGCVHVYECSSHKTQLSQNDSMQENVGTRSMLGRVLLARSKLQTADALLAPS